MVTNNTPVMSRTATIRSLETQIRAARNAYSTCPSDGLYDHIRSLESSLRWATR